ncbi:MAG: IS1595 family transposase [Hydrogenophilaceae bacterium]|jgi:transposase-like protein|nr:IS1595 family transposase [Hydrogenophilaceae bacterium]
MAKSVLSAPHFQDEDAAFEYVEARLWPNGAVCHHCGATGEKIGRLTGKTARAGLRKCYACRKTFTVRMGTILESSHLPLRFWLQAIHLLCTSKKGVSTRQIQRMFKCSMKTAWHLMHRIRFGMEPDHSGPLMGGPGERIEADETFLTNSPKTKKAQGYQHKIAVLTIAERGGRQRSVMLERSPARPQISRFIRANVDPESTLVTDGAQYYRAILVNHETVDHSKDEWVRGDAHVNTLEGWFSVLKRGMIGTYQNVKEKHLRRYLSEFDFRQNTRERLGVDDERRAELALAGFKGRRLTYRSTDRRSGASA